MTQTERNYFNTLCSDTNVYGKKKSSKELFVDSIIIAEMFGVPDNEILKTENDIQHYFQD